MKKEILAFLLANIFKKDLKEDCSHIDHDLQSHFIKVRPGARSILWCLLLRFAGFPSYILFNYIMPENCKEEGIGELAVRTKIVEFASNF